MRPSFEADAFLTVESLAIHFYERGMRIRLLEKFDGVPRPRSLIGRLVRKQSIAVAAAPLIRKAVASPQLDEVTA